MYSGDEFFDDDITSGPIETELMIDTTTTTDFVNAQWERVTANKLVAGDVVRRDLHDSPIHTLVSFRQSNNPRAFGYKVWATAAGAEFRPAPQAKYFRAVKP